MASGGIAWLLVNMLRGLGMIGQTIWEYLKWRSSLERNAFEILHTHGRHSFLTGRPLIFRLLDHVRFISGT